MRHTRRELLAATAGGAVLGAASGCQGAFARSEPAVLTYKGIDIRWSVDRTERYVAALCWLWSDGRSRVVGWEPAENPEIVRSPAAVSVTGETPRRLRERFEAVTYVLGFSGAEATELSPLESTFGQVVVSRERFNRVGFTDRARVARTDRGVRVRGVDPGGNGDLAGWDVDIGSKDLREQFPDSGVPPPG